MQTVWVCPMLSGAGHLAQALLAALQSFRTKGKARKKIGTLSLHVFVFLFNFPQQQK